MLANTEEKAEGVSTQQDLPIYLPISTYLPISIYPSVRPFVRPSVCLSHAGMSTQIYLSIYPSVWLSVCLSQTGTVMGLMDGTRCLYNGVLCQCVL